MLALFVVWLGALALQAAPQAPQPGLAWFSIPAGAAESGFRLFARQTGVEVVFEVDQVRGIQTRAVVGNFTPRGALEELVAGTGLVVLQDEPTGALTVKSSRPDASQGAKIPPPKPMNTHKTLRGWLAALFLTVGASPLPAQSDPPVKTTEATTATSPATPSAPTKPADEKKTADEAPLKLDEFIVTGVFGPQEKKGSLIAISTIDKLELAQLSPVSAADLLKSVPGVVVNTALGEIRNIVYSRGISANSQDGNNGYFYVSQQEDGLPVQNALATNNGPDYYLRADLMTRRVEAVRGGAAAITGPNAPGGIFNYISKNGLSDPGTQIQTKIGSEGRAFGNNPYYRFDFYSGGSFSNKLHYAIGGFYRDSTGPRDPGYSMNHGGQIRANLIAEYPNGQIQLNLKYLDDHNLWDEFLPAQGIKNPRPLGAFNFNSSVNPPSGHDHAFPALDDNFTVGRPSSSDRWDPRDGIHSTSKVVDLNWDHKADGWAFNNKLKHSTNRSDWSTGAAIFAMSVDTPGLYGPAPFGNGILAVGETTSSGVTAYTGIISLADHSTGKVLARVRSAVDATGNPTFTLLNSSLPDDPALPNAILVQTAYAPDVKVRETIEQFTAIKELENMSFTAGFFYATSDLTWRSGEGGVGLAQFTPRRDLLDITIERDNGTIQKVTSPDGFAGLGKIGSFTNFASRAEQDQVSLFFGHNWKITNQLTLDWGARYEKIKVNGSNQTASQFTDSVGGGLDGNPNTLYDNTLQKLNFPTRFGRKFSYWAYSPALSYKWSSQHTTYVRYASSQKAPSLSGFIDPGDGVTGVSLIPEKIKQLELGYSYYGHGTTISVTPFLTKMTDVGGFGSPIQFSDIDGTNYVRPIPLNNIETRGVEFEADARIQTAFNIHAAITYVADSKATNNARWTHPTAGKSGDVLVKLPDGNAVNQPDLTVTTTGSYLFEGGSAHLTWRHVGDRWANAGNTFKLVSYDVFDTGINYSINRHLDLNLLVKNVGNSRGVVSWQGAGNFQGLDRSLTPTKELWSIVTVQPRAFFFTTTYTFLTRNAVYLDTDVHPSHVPQSSPLIAGVSGLSCKRKSLLFRWVTYYMRALQLKERMRRRTGWRNPIGHEPD